MALLSLKEAAKKREELLQQQYLSTMETLNQQLAAEYRGDGGPFNIKVKILDALKTRILDEIRASKDWEVTDVGPDYITMRSKNGR